MKWKPQDYTAVSVVKSQTHALRYMQHTCPCPRVDYCLNCFRSFITKKSSLSLFQKTSSETSQSEPSVSLSESKSKSSLHSLVHETRIASFLSNSTVDAKDKSALCPDEDDVEGDSFFDDPIPKPEKTYGWRSEPRKQVGGLASLSDKPHLRSGLSSLAGAPSLTDAESKYLNTLGFVFSRQLWCSLLCCGKIP